MSRFLQVYKCFCNNHNVDFILENEVLYRWLKPQKISLTNPPECQSCHKVKSTRKQATAVVTTGGAFSNPREKVSVGEKHRQES